MQLIISWSMKRANWSWWASVRGVGRMVWPDCCVLLMGRGKRQRCHCDSEVEQGWWEALGRSAVQILEERLSGRTDWGWVGRISFAHYRAFLLLSFPWAWGYSSPNLNKTYLSVVLMLKAFSLIIFKPLLQIICVCISIWNYAVRKKKKKGCTKNT